MLKQKRMVKEHELTVLEKEAYLDAWDKYLSKYGKGVLVADKRGFDAGFIAGIQANTGVMD